jgi:hypothetical protein
MPDSKHQPICLQCDLAMTLELEPGGKTPRTFQCLNCERPDPLKSEAMGWLSGGLKPPT